MAELDANHRRHAHAASLIAACDAGLTTLSGDNALGSRLQHLRSGLQREAAHEPRLHEVDGMLESAAIQLDEAFVLLERIRDDLDLDPDALAEIERQLTRVQDLARKHRIAPEQLAAHRDALAIELDSLADADATLQQLERDIANAQRDWQHAAKTLHTSRQQAATALADAVTALIAELGMQGGRFEVQLEANTHATPCLLYTSRCV